MFSTINKQSSYRVIQLITCDPICLFPHWNFLLEYESVQSLSWVLTLLVEQCLIEMASGTVGEEFEIGELFLDEQPKVKTIFRS
jgi:hypothetical protein